MSTQRTRLSLEQSEKVKDIVLSCILANRSVNETIEIVDRRLNVKLAIDTIKHLRMKVRKEAFEELQLMKTDNETYLYQYLKNIEQTKKVINETWNLADLALEVKDYDLRRQCLNDITNHTVTLHKLYDFLPAVCSMKVWDESEFVPHTTANYDRKRLNIQ
jgi:hypothetical protein